GRVAAGAGAVLPDTQRRAPALGVDRHDRPGPVVRRDGGGFLRQRPAAEPGLGAVPGPLAVGGRHGVSETGRVVGTTQRHGPPTYHEFLVSRALGGGGLIGLHLARFLRRLGQDGRVLVPGAGPVRLEAERLGLAIGEFDPAPAFGASHWRTALVNWRLW